MRQEVAQGARGQRRRGEIVEAARRLFALHGLAGTSLADVLEAVSASKGAFYHHFRSKDDLAQAVLSAVRADYQREVIEPVVQSQEPAGRRWLLYLERLVALNRSGGWDNCLLMARLSQETTEPMAGKLAEQVAVTLEWLMEQWAQALVAGQSVGTVRSDVAARLMAELIVWTLYGEISSREHQEGLAHLENMADAIVKLISA